jgi:hypothetical protein
LFFKCQPVPPGGVKVCLEYWKGKNGHGLLRGPSANQCQREARFILSSGRVSAPSLS